MTSRASARRCKGHTATGAACGARPGADGWCFVHSPHRGAERAAARRAGGHARHTPHSSATPPADVHDLAGVLAVLNYSLSETLVHDNSLLRVRVLVQLAAGFVEALKIGELEDRLAALERAMVKA